MVSLYCPAVCRLGWAVSCCLVQTGSQKVAPVDFGTVGFEIADFETAAIVFAAFEIVAPVVVALVVGSFATGTGAVEEQSSVASLGDR